MTDLFTLATDLSRLRAELRGLDTVTFVLLSLAAVYLLAALAVDFR